MKTVFTNVQCAHVWAQQSQSKGKGGGGIFFEGKTIYSYGYHFPLARFLTDNIVLINADSYSVSTSKHQGYVQQAVSHKTRLWVSTSVIKAFADYRDDNPVMFPPQVQDLVVLEAFEAFEAGMEKAAKRRVKRCKTEDTIAAIGKLEIAAEFFTVLSVAVPSKLAEAIQKYSVENKDALDGYLAEIEQAEKDKKAKQLKDYETAKHLWLAHKVILKETYGVSGYDLANGPTLLRVSKNGEEIETSRGATFPIEHAKRVFTLVRNCHDGKFVWLREQIDQRILSRLDTTLGHFRVDEIDAKGNVKAGCHFVEWEAIERCAIELKIYP